jgi:hypothetical protein
MNEATLLLTALVFLPSLAALVLASPAFQRY